MSEDSSAEIRNIIVRMPNWIGDLVMATPILQDLRKRYPDANIAAMCKHPQCDLLREDPCIDEVFCFTKPSGFFRRTENRSIIEKLQESHYDLGILLTNSFSSAWWFYRGKVKKRIGFAVGGRSLLLTHAVPIPQEKQHLVKTYKTLLQPLGILDSTSTPKLFVKEAEMLHARAILTELGIPEKATLVGINPGAAYGLAKCWLPERFREVTRRLIKNPNLFVLYFGDSAHAPLIKDICRELGPQVSNLAGLTTLRQLSCLIKHCKILLTNDSGPMHIADALDVPVVALFGSTDANLTGPYNQGSVIYKQVSCSPCFKRTCPIDFRCMKNIEVDEVYNSIMKCLNKNPLSIL